MRNAVNSCSSPALILSPRHLFGRPAGRQAAQAAPGRPGRSGPAPPQTLGESGGAAQRAPRPLRQWRKIHELQNGWGKRHSRRTTRSGLAGRRNGAIVFDQDFSAGNLSAGREKVGPNGHFRRAGRRKWPRLAAPQTQACLRLTVAARQLTRRRQDQEPARPAWNRFRAPSCCDTRLIGQQACCSRRRRAAHQSLFQSSQACLCRGRARSKFLHLNRRHARCRFRLAESLLARTCPTAFRSRARPRRHNTVEDRSGTERERESGHKRPSCVSLVVE